MEDPTTRPLLASNEEESTNNGIQEESCWSGDKVKSMVYAELDAILTSFSLFSSISATQRSSGSVLVLGLANLVADGISMGFHAITVPNHKGDILKDTEWIGDGQLPGHEDLAYDSETKFVFTGCGDGWIKRFKIDDDDDVELASRLKVENWSFVGGRPLGIAFGPDRWLKNLEFSS